jgi:hypothetical protein
VTNHKVLSLDNRETFLRYRILEAQAIDSLISDATVELRTGLRQAQGTVQSLTVQLNDSKTSVERATVDLLETVPSAIEERAREIAGAYPNLPFTVLVAILFCSAGAFFAWRLANRRKIGRFPGTIPSVDS